LTLDHFHSFLCTKVGTPRKHRDARTASHYAAIRTSGMYKRCDFQRRSSEMSADRAWSVVCQFEM
jgi:hypothetical protein